MSLQESLSTVDFVAGANSAGSNLGIGRATKKVRTRSDISFDFDDPTVDGNGRAISPEPVRQSYKSTLL